MMSCETIPITIDPGSDYAQEVSDGVVYIEKMGRGKFHAWFPHTDLIFYCGSWPSAKKVVRDELYKKKWKNAHAQQERGQ